MKYASAACTSSSVAAMRIEPISIARMTAKIEITQLPEKISRST